MRKIGQFWRLLGRIEKAFLLCTLIFLILYFTRVSRTAETLFGLAGILLGIVALFRAVRRAMKKAIWRLRNRLIVAYLFIAVVPIVLITTLLVIAGYAVIAQMSIYLVNRELDHRETSLLRPAETLARFPLRDSETAVNRFVTMTRPAFPDVEVLVTGKEELHYPENTQLGHPPAEWSKSQRASGLVMKNKKLYAWAHVVEAGNEVTVLAPLSHELLAEFVPGLGDVDFKDVNFKPVMGRVRASHLPAPLNAMDFRVGGIYPVTAPHWESPDTKTQLYLLVDTRLSAVLGIVFGEKQEWGEKVLDWLIASATIFFMVELASLIAGVRLSRTITGAVHELYAGTEKVKEGNFAYRVPVKGNDQLADLTTSFNTMTENLGRLLIVAKEKERLESELEIAREVQAQLFPKDVPSTETLELKGVCHPARTVSGDYYDFMALPNITAFAIGDVAGKGISAALLMATIQSTMRTQLGAVDCSIPHLSTARLVSNLNKMLFATTAPEKYATFYFALYDETEQTLMYTNAGHLSPFLVRGSNILPLDSTGTVVGAFAWAKYEERTVKLEPGDLVVAYTDGITEPENEYGEMYGEDQLKDLLVKYVTADSSEIIARTMEAVNHWTKSPELQDDMTMVVARRI
jgi:sigma-B regulation protein RsbU (phosphoserine phosphatase)